MSDAPDPGPGGGDGTNPDRRRRSRRRQGSEAGHHGDRHGDRRRRHRRRETGAEADEAGARRASSVPPERSSAVLRKVRAGLTKKLRFFTDLMRHLDMLVFAELCVLYYMDCSFFRLFLRSVAQSFFLSPRAEDFLLVAPAHKPHVVAVFAPNVLCLLVHLLAPLPRASEANRGYLHGGILIDFVGQAAPRSRHALLLLDLVVLAVQCLMLAVHTEREKLRKLLLPLRGSASSTTAATAAALAGVVPEGAADPGSSPTGQDHDAEERGVHLPGAGAGPLPGDDESADALAPEAAADHVLDALSAGSNLCDFYVVHAIRSASRDYQGAAAQSLQSIGYAVTLARLAAERGARARQG